jgi:DNA/RNA-binding domain of Phe-tRNA-synthetase-like protein
MTSFLPQIAPEIWSRFPEYRALSVVVLDLDPERPIAVTAFSPAPWADAHTEAWHQAFRSFGSNPKRTPPSVDSLLRRYRKDGALPAIHPVVDCYNALSIQFGAPFGGEDLDCYSGIPRLVVADGSEVFGTMRDGQLVDEKPEPGEVIWRDDEGVTCRRWNWRQCKRTAITARSTNLWFVIDRLPPMAIADLERAGEALTGALQEASPGCSCSVDLLCPDDQ